MGKDESRRAVGLRVIQPLCVCVLPERCRKDLVSTDQENRDVTCQSERKVSAAVTTVNLTWDFKDKDWIRAHFHQLYSCKCDTIVLLPGTRPTCWHVLQLCAIWKLELVCWIFFFCLMFFPSLLFFFPWKQTDLFSLHTVLRVTYSGMKRPLITVLKSLFFQTTWNAESLLLIYFFVNAQKNVAYLTSNQGLISRSLPCCFYSVSFFLFF